MFIKFDRNFLDDLNLEIPDIEEDFSLNVAGQTLGFLLNKYSWKEVGEEAEIKADLKQSYGYMVATLYPLYLHAKSQQGIITLKNSQEINQEWGEEKQEGTFFEPVVDNEQAEVKTTGGKTTWTPDTQTIDSEREEFRQNNELITFYNDIPSHVIKAFSQYINLYVMGV